MLQKQVPAYLKLCALMEGGSAGPNRVSQPSNAQLLGNELLRSVEQADFADLRNLRTERFQVFD